MYDSNAIKIYIDGSCMPNPGKGGVGVIVEFPDKFNMGNYEISEGYTITNNQRMELIACITAIRWLVSNSSSLKATRAIIITDSDYVYSNYEHAEYWKKEKWMDQNGKPYENKDIWDIFLKERHKLRISNEIRWEKGKTRPILEHVDDLAKQGALHPTKTDYGYQIGKFTSYRTLNKKAAKLFPANNDELCVRVYMKRIYGKNDSEIYKITFEIYDEKSKSYTNKFFAYKDKRCMTLERNNCYKVKMNSNPKFPLIMEAEHIEYLK